MVAPDNPLSSMLRGGFTDLLGNETLVVEAMKDLLRDEIKKKMRESLDADPQLKKELQDAVRMYFEARVHQAYATLMFVKASAKLGVEMLPPQLRDDLGKEIGHLVEKEMAALLEKAV